MNLIVSFPSGPRPGNLTCGPQEKKGPDKQTREARKKQMHLLRGAYLPSASKKNKFLLERKRSRKGPFPVIALRRSARGQLFPSWPACLTRLRPRNLTCGPQEKKAGAEKQTAEARKRIRICFFLLASDGKLTIKSTCPNSGP